MFASYFRCICPDINFIQRHFSPPTRINTCFLLFCLSDCWDHRLLIQTDNHQTQQRFIVQGLHTDPRSSFAFADTVSYWAYSYSVQRRRKRKLESVHPLYGVVGAEWSPRACREGLFQFNAGIHPLSFSSMSSVLLHQLSGLKDPRGWSANFFLIALASCVGHDKLAHGWNGKLHGHPFLWNSMMFPGLADRKFWQHQAAFRGKQARDRIAAWPDLLWTVLLCNTQGFSQHPPSLTVMFFHSFSWVQRGGTTAPCWGGAKSEQS